MQGHRLSNSPSRLLLTVNAAAERLAIKPATIRRRILEKRIGYVKVGRSVRIPVETVEEILKSGYQEPVNLNRADA